jgi:hypothetical protein
MPRRRRSRDKAPAHRSLVTGHRSRSSAAFDPIGLEVFNHRLAAIAEEMGVALCRSAFSPNIKERRDYSCAVFDAGGSLAAQAAHIPVHLGSTPLSVAAAIASQPMARGDVVILNDPYAGGTHLPDVTAVAPVFAGRTRIGYVANRAHHADIGGMTPGSMPLAAEIYQEGFSPAAGAAGARRGDGPRRAGTVSGQHASGRRAPRRSARAGGGAARRRAPSR